jgi:magnesium transporter
VAQENEKVLTIVTSVFIPLGFITGLCRMNFDFEASPYNMPELHWLYGYPTALTIMATMVVGMLFYILETWLAGSIAVIRIPI